MSSLVHDLRYAARALRRNPGFAAIAVLTLALGIGANAMVFGLLEATLLREPAVRSPETLVAVYTTSRAGSPRSSSSYPDYVDYRDRTAALEDLAAYDAGVLTVGDEAGAEFVDAELVSGNYFELLGVATVRGRPILPVDDAAGGDHRVAVLSHAFWQARFGGNPEVVGSTIRINELPFTVVGIGEESFRGLRLGATPGVWVPIRAQAALNPLPPLPGGAPGPAPDVFEMRGARWISGMVGRLAEGATLERARAELTGVSDQLAAEDPDARGPRTVTVDPLPGYIRPNGSEGTISTFVWVLQGVVAFTLLLACANLANLLLARGSSRRRELAVRTAIGAGRKRLVRQLMTENLLLAALGAGTGLLLASLALSAMGSFELPFGFEVASLDAEVNPRVAAFTALVAFVTVMAFGTLPALQGTHGNMAGDLREGRSTGGLRGRRLLQSLVGLQVAVCFVLLVGAGLFLRTLRHQLDTDLGFEPAGVALLSLNPEVSGYGDPQSAALARDLIAGLEELPGVEAASAGVIIPVTQGSMATFVRVDGYTPAPDEEMRLEYNYVAPDFFRTLRLPILRGRDFTADDGPGAPGVAIVSEGMAEAWWPGGDPIGRTIRFGPPTDETVLTVVGVAADAAWGGLEISSYPMVFRPLLQDQPGGRLSIVARTDPDRVSALLPLIRERIAQIDPNLPIVDLRPMSGVVNTLLAPERAGAALLTAFAALALLLACVGIYGVVAYAVEQRRREFGIRIALGAPIGALVSLVARGMGAPVVIGTVAGLMAALALGPAVGSLLVGVDPGDPTTLLVTTLLLAAAAAAAATVPARRATRTDPMEAMRAE